MLERLSSLSREDSGRVGAKAASLGELSRLGLWVPNGFVIDPDGAAAIQSQEAGSGRRAETVSLIRQAFSDLRAERVAVRSSANVEDSVTSSFAGVFESTLGVCADGLLDAVMRCLASATSSRVLAYCDAHGMRPAEIRVSVIVQAMVDADAAGVCFTSDPVTGDESRAYVEIVRGLGDSLVGGRAAPDAFSVDIASQRVTVIERGRDGAADVVDMPTVARIVADCCRIRAHFGRPQDVEFAVERGNIYFLQARPITVRGFQDTWGKT